MRSRGPLTVAATAAAAAVAWSLQPAAASASPSVFKAASYGAICDGTMHSNAKADSVDRVAIQSAVNDAEAAQPGSAVLLPAGRCVLSSALILEHGPGIVLEGTVRAGNDATTVTDTDNPGSSAGDLTITSDGDTVQDLTLDQRGYGQAAYVRANRTTFQRLSVIGGTDFFALFFVATAGGPARGNRLLDSTVVSQIRKQVGGGTAPCDDGISWSGQDQSLIEDLDFTGTRLALYADRDTTLDSFTFHPGSQRCGTDGFFVTETSSELTLEHLRMHGSAGEVDNGSPSNAPSRNISIIDEQVMAPTAATGDRINAPAHGLVVNNVSGLTIDQSSFDSGDPSNSSIKFTPVTGATGVVVEHTTVPRVAFYARTANGVAGSVNRAEFSDDTYPAIGSSLPLDDTFVNGGGGHVDFAVDGGVWRNRAGGFSQGTMSYTVTGLAGYR